MMLQSIYWSTSAKPADCRPPRPCLAFAPVMQVLGFMYDQVFGQCGALCVCILQAGSGPLSSSGAPSLPEALTCLSLPSTR